MASETDDVRLAIALSGGLGSLDLYLTMMTFLNC
jgi:hypothetical protein